MPARIDSKSAITTMIGDPRTFPTIAAAIDKDIAKYLAGHFKDKGMGLDRLRATHDAFGKQDAALIFEALDEKAVAALLKKVDPHRQAGEPTSALTRLMAIASGDVGPEPKPEKPSKATARKTGAPLTRAGSGKAASARGTGTRPVDPDGAGASAPPATGAPARKQRRSKPAPPEGR